jgi:outer membrane protein assembly factor BamB
MKQTLARRYQFWLTVLVLLAFAVTSTAAPNKASDNWPQWRGPLQNGVAPSADPPSTWSETNNVRWKTKIPGSGSATPLVWGTQVFVQTAVPTGKRVEAAKAEEPTPAAGAGADRTVGEAKKQAVRSGFGGEKPAEFYRFEVLSLDRATGKVLWEQVAREEVPHEGFRQNEGSLASNSGITDGEHVFAYFGSRGLYCYDLKGNLKWSQDLGKMRIIMGFGEGSSPALHKDALVVNWDNEEGSYILALDKNTGKTLWREARDERTSWSTPLVIEYDGKSQVVVAATGKIRSYDLETGKIIWECRGLTRNVIPSPVTDGEMVYCMSGFQGNSLMAIRLGRTGDLTGTDAIAWTYKKNTPYVPSPLLYGGKLYFFASNNGILSCLDAKSGEVLVNAERVEALQGVYASLVGAAGRIYLTGRNGATVVLKQSDKFDVLATNRLEEKFDASPAVAGKELFLRGRDYLYCLAEK